MPGADNRAAGGGERIPTLKNVLDLVDKRCRLFIELKAHRATAPVVDIVTHYVKNLGWSYEQLFLCSFDHLQIATARTLNPDIRTCALLVGIPVSLSAIAVEAGAWAINPNVHHLNQALVDDAHERGLHVFAWTANEPPLIHNIKQLGVDGIISDFPDRL